jgi:hypothetical protein
MNKQNTKVGGIDIQIQGRWSEIGNSEGIAFEYKVLDSQSDTLIHIDDTSENSVSEMSFLVEELQLQGSKISDPTFLDTVHLGFVLANLANLLRPSRLAV